MMKDMRKELVFPVLALAILIAILVAGGVFTGTVRFSGRSGVTLSLNEEGKPWGPLPDGPQTYQVVSSEDAWPKFSEATINPLKVYPGDTQRMRVVVQDRVEVTEVLAEIETDNGVNEVPLRLVNEAAVTEEDILKQRYIVQDGKLIMLGELERTKLALSGFLKRAEAADVRKFVFEGEWVVKDTHVKTYHTTFRAKNASGEENSITMAWSDPCSGIADGTNSTLAGNCAIGTNVTDGIDGGSLNLGGYTVTLAGSGSTFVWNSGQNLTINGSIVINSGAQLRQTNLWIQDQDGDGWSDGSTWLYGATCSGCTRRYLSAGLGTGDCYYALPTSTTYAHLANPGQVGYITVPRGDGSFDYNCNLTEENEFVQDWQCQCDQGVDYCGGCVLGTEVSFQVPSQPDPSSCGLAIQYVPDPQQYCQTGGPSGQCVSIYSNYTLGCR